MEIHGSRLSKKVTENSQKNQARRRVRRVCIFPERKRRENISSGQEIARKIVRFSDVPARPMLNGMNAFATVQDFLDSYENVWEVLTAKVKNGEDLPKIYAACGTEDFLYDTFVKFRKHCEKIGAPIVFEEIEGYAHEWRFWDLTIQKAITFFGLDKPEDAGNPF